MVPPHGGRGNAMRALSDTDRVATSSAQTSNVSGLRNAEKRTQADVEDRAQRADDLFQVGLGGAEAAVFEDDGCFPDLAAGFAAAIEDLLLKGIAARDGVSEADAAELGDLVAAIAAAGVVGGQAHEDADDEVDAAAHELARQRPVDGAAARDIARADHDVVAFHA